MDDKDVLIRTRDQRSVDQHKQETQIRSKNLMKTIKKRKYLKTIFKREKIIFRGSEAKEKMYYYVNKCLYK